MVYTLQKNHILKSLVSNTLCSLNYIHALIDRPGMKEEAFQHVIDIRYYHSLIFVDANYIQ